MLLVCHLATSCVVMPPAISCILLAIMFVAMPLFSVFVVVLFATTCVALPSAIPRSTLSDIVCFNASCPWYSLVLLLATTCVAMSPAMFCSTSSHHLCCDASCYILSIPSDHMCCIPLILDLGFLCALRSAASAIDASAPMCNTSSPSCLYGPLANMCVTNATPAYVSALVHTSHLTPHTIHLHITLYLSHITS